MEKRVSGMIKGIRQDKNISEQELKEIIKFHFKKTAGELNDEEGKKLIGILSKEATREGAKKKEFNTEDYF